MRRAAIGPPLVALAAALAVSPAGALAARATIGPRPLLRATFARACAAEAGGAAGDGAGSSGDVPARLLPCGDALDRRIMALSIPAVINFMILPLTNSVDLYWVGRMGDALATAGMGAANQVFSSVAWLTGFIPTVATPMIAGAAARGDTEAVQRHIAEAIFLSLALGLALTGALALFQEPSLLAVGSAAGLRYSLPYLAYRLPGLAADALSTVGFAAFRGVKDTVTPLQISALSNLVNIVLDPLLMFAAGWGIVGAALATTASQLFGAAAYIVILLRRKMVRLGAMFRPPSFAGLKQIGKAGLAVQIRALALNFAFIAVTRTTQRLDPTGGLSAAAHLVAIQLWQIGGVILFALSTVAQILVPAELSRPGGGARAAQATSSRLLAWGAVLGAAIGGAQLAALPTLKFFAPTAEVAALARVPSIIGALLQLINGVAFIGEGVMVGAGSFGALAAGQVIATAALVSALRFATTLTHVWLGFWLFNGIRLLSVLRHQWRSMTIFEARAKAQRRAP